MKTKKTVLLSSIICLILALPALPFVGTCTKPTSASTLAPIEVKIGIFSPPTSPTTKNVWEPYAKLIEETTKGRIKVTIYPGTLFQPPNAYDATVSGISDISWVNPALNPNRFPLCDILALPFMDLKDGIAASLCHQHVYDTIPEFRDQFKDVKVLFMFTDNASPIGSGEKPLRRLEDLKGLKFRVQGGPPQAWFKAAGATPLILPPGDIYTNMDKGVIDGWNIAWSGAAAYKLWEVTQYFTDAKVSYVPMFVVMNLHKWNSLPPDVQKDLDSISGVAGAKFLGGHWNEDNLKNIQKVKDTDREIITLSPEEQARWAALADPIISRFISDVDAKGLPGTKTLEEVKKFMAAYK